MYNSKDIVYSSKDFWILNTPESYELYKINGTHSKRVGRVSKKLGLNKAIQKLNILHINK